MWSPIASERGSRAQVRAGGRECSQRGNSIGPINPINPCAELACSLFPRAKIEHCWLNYRPFGAAFSGISRDFCSLGPGISFCILFRTFMSSHFSNRPVKWWLYKINKTWIKYCRTSQKGKRLSCHKRVFLRWNRRLEVWSKSALIRGRCPAW